MDIQYQLIRSKIKLNALKFTLASGGFVHCCFFFIFTINQITILDDPISSLTCVDFDLTKCPMTIVPGISTCECILLKIDPADLDLLYLQYREDPNSINFTFQQILYFDDSYMGIHADKMLLVRLDLPGRDIFFLTKEQYLTFREDYLSNLAEKLAKDDK
jgi:hypothetical protein